MGLHLARPDRGGLCQERPHSWSVPSLHTWHERFPNLEGVRFTEFTISTNAFSGKGVYGVEVGLAVDGQPVLEDGLKPELRPEAYTGEGPFKYGFGLRSLDMQGRYAGCGKAVDLPVAADESIRRSTDPLRVVRAEAADIVVLKAQPLGGVRACLQLAAECGLPAVVSSAVETSVGLAAGLALAAALPELPYACGLGTIDLLDRDVVEAPLVPIGGALPVRRPAPDVKLLAAAAADPPTAERWHARLHDVRHVLDHSVRDMPALAYATLGNGPTFGIASA